MDLLINPDEIDEVKACGGSAWLARTLKTTSQEDLETRIKTGESEGGQGEGGTGEGRMLFVLSGKVANPGIVEAPWGTSLRKLINELGGGVANGKEFKAALVGGPFGGFLPETALDLPLEFENLAGEGAALSSFIEVLDGDDCIIDAAKGCMALTRSESCGKCVFCREGTAQMHLILNDITQGKGRPEDMDLLTELGEAMQSGTLCPFGQWAPTPVLTGLRHFRDEIEGHIRRKRCQALVCKRFISYHILPDRCQGCGACLEKCPVGAIEGGEGLIHVIDGDLCTRCGNCLESCPAEYNAISKAGAVKPKTPDLPIPVGSWKKKR